MGQPGRALIGQAVGAGQAGRVDQRADSQLAAAVSCGGGPAALAAWVGGLDADRVLCVLAQT